MPIVDVKLLAGAFTSDEKVALLKEIRGAFERALGAPVGPRVHATITDIDDGFWLAEGEILTLGEIERRRKARAPG